MCLITEVTTKYGDGHSDITKTLSFCSNSVNNRACNNLNVDHIEERVPGSSSQLALRPSSSRRDEVVLHQNMPRQHRQEPRQERRYAGQVDVKIRNGVPHFSIRRLDDGGSRSRRRHGEYESRRASGVVMPEAPMPPPLAIVHQSGRRSPPPSAMPTLVPSPNRPTPPQGPGAAIAFTTRDTVPSSSDTLSRASSSRSRDARRAVRDLTLLNAPASSSSVTSNRHPRPTPGLSRLRVDSRQKFRDSAYGGSSNISPVDAPKTNTLSETRSNTTSERSANVRYNYSNGNAVIRRDDYDVDEEDRKSNSSKGRKGYRIVRRVKGNDDPEMTQRKMQKAIKEAEDYQSQTGEQFDG